MIVTFEGIDGSGKSTQIKLLSEYLESKGIRHITTFEPGSTETGKKLREILLSSNSDIDQKTELFLYLADRMEHINKVIIPAIAEGKIVLCDRYIDSTIAYQAYGRGIDLKLIESLNSIFFPDVKPDLTFLLDISISESLERKSLNDDMRRFENEDFQFFSKVKNGYMDQWLKNSYRIRVVNGLADKKEVFYQIKDHFENFYKRYLNKMRKTGL